jgi:tRNA uridine 5-carboxymethylaminomethyl modification enzyme
VKHIKCATYDVLVVGGGHAGVEAAAAAARMGAVTALLTHNRSSIGAMSCNPAFGGLGKGHLIREIDALDGVMGRAADAAAIQFRTLNRSKGPAVQGPRVQADRDLYKKAVARILTATPNLTILEDECENICTKNGKLSGVRTRFGKEVFCKAVVIATGTFLNGVIYIGGKAINGGRIGESAVTKLAQQFRNLGFETGRLKTGTPPRLRGASIDFGVLDPQWGDDRPQFLSFLSSRAEARQAPCYITRTNSITHGVIASNLHKTATYSGGISGVGPRYCPSIEDKVVRFPEKDSHQIFLEPEGLDLETIYPNGISTSLPGEVQDALVRSIPGMENAQILQHGYAIEYDFVNPTQLLRTLMARQLDGLFLAGQINGTTGYEEAGAQGIVAGINAALYASGRSEQIFDRADCYLGVLIDDLTTRGVSEPYRIFTSRAEYRLRLRADNADERLTSFGAELGVVGACRGKIYRAKSEAIERARKGLNAIFASADQLQSAGIAVIDSTGMRRSAFEWAARSGVLLSEMARVWPEISGIAKTILDRLDADAKYSSYLVRQDDDVKRHKADESLLIPRDLDFYSIDGLSSEMKQKFSKRRPATVGQAGRIEGVTPAALMLLAGRAKRVCSAA